MQFLDKIHTVFTATLKTKTVLEPTILDSVVFFACCMKCKKQRCLLINLQYSQQSTSRDREKITMPVELEAEPGILYFIQSVRSDTAVD